VIARPRSSSPSEGSAAVHAKIQEQIVKQAFELASKPRPAAVG
jgi:2-oxoglutarate dehydrogenase complex dehydrogenase (E1) component-like enzyme